MYQQGAGNLHQPQVWVDLSDAIARVADSLTLEQLRNEWLAEQREGQAL